MNKVVINEKYGGFNLSIEAIKMLMDKGYKATMRIAFGEETWRLDEHIDRHNKDLVEVVELLKDKANTEYSDLRVVEIPGDKYHIFEYDGWETIVFPEMEDWITITETA